VIGSSHSHAVRGRRVPFEVVVDAGFRLRGSRQSHASMGAIAANAADRPRDPASGLGFSCRGSAARWRKVRGLGPVARGANATANCEHPVRASDDSVALKPMTVLDCESTTRSEHAALAYAYLRPAPRVPRRESGVSAAAGARAIVTIFSQADLKHHRHAPARSSVLVPIA